MYEDAIGSILFGLQDDQAEAKAKVAALRGQPPQPPPGMPPPGAPPGMPPPQPGDWSSSQQPAGQAPATFQPPPQQPMPQQGPSPARQGPMLPQAMGQGQQPPPAPPAPIPDIPDPLEARQQALMQNYQTALQPPDRGPAEEAYRKRAGQGGQHLLMALAAQEAGKDFAPISAHFLKQSAAAQEPMRMTGGTMTPEGFIEDPGYKQELTLRKIEAQMTANQRIIDSNARRQDKIDAEKRNADLRREMAEFSRGTAWGAANIAAGAANQGGPGKATYEGVDTQGREVVRDKMGRPWVMAGQNPDGTPKYEPLAGGGVIPKQSYEKGVAEASTHTRVADNADKLITQAQQHVDSFGLAQSAASMVPGVLGKAKAQKAAGMTPEAIQFRGRLAREAAAEMNDLYGAAQSAPEAERAKQFLIDVKNDTVEEILTKLTSARDYARSKSTSMGPAVGQAVTARTGIAPAGQPPAQGGGRVVDFSALPK